MSNHQLIIPVEIKVREFEAKLLLARAACLEGFKVIFGERYAVQRYLSLHPHGIYYGKDITKPVEKLYRLITGLGCRLVAQDEEALVYYSRDIYRRRRFHAPTCAQTSALFSWGPDNTELWQKSPGFNDTPIFQTGNPRFDLLRGEFGYLYADAVARLRSRFGDYILVNTTFGHVNAFHPRDVKMPDPSALDETVEHRGGTLPRAYDPELSRHRNHMFREFKKLLPQFASALPDKKIILRPHPNESLEVWRELLAEHSNVEIIHEGAATPWIIAAKAVIHNGSTTGIEALRLGVPAIAYRPIRDDAYECTLPNELSYQAYSLEELLEAIRYVYSSNLTDLNTIHTPDLTLLHRFLVQSDTQQLSVELIAKALVKLEKVPTPPFFQRLKCRWKLAKTEYKRARKEAGRDALWQEYRSHLFPPTSAERVAQVLESYAKVLPSDRQLAVTELRPNLFQISRTT